VSYVVALFFMGILAIISNVLELITQYMKKRRADALQNYANWKASFELRRRQRRRNVYLPDELRKDKLP